MNTHIVFCSSFDRCTIGVLTGQVSPLLSEIQHLEDQITSDVVVLRVLDCTARPLIYNSACCDELSTLTVSDLLESSPPQWINDVSSQIGAKNTVSSENLQV